MRLADLRQKHPKFIYQDFSVKEEKNNLKISFSFQIEPDIKFSPKVTIEQINRSQISNLDKETVNNLAFHLGLMEIPSYWKATCSPEIIIAAGFLTAEQIRWWKNLILNGLGQFFYTNKIDFTSPNFVKIKTTKKRKQAFLPSKRGLNQDKILVPVGGGKDSIVTLEILKKTSQNLNCLILNPTPATLKIIEIAHCKNPIIVRREIDKQLLELNKKGYLNGHTPFSAYIGFLSTVCAILFDFGKIAVSDERSANEENLTYLGKKINHQYSKSFHFEKAFAAYAKKYLAENLYYFSFLQPLYEFQVCQLFSQYPRYFPYFKSCNKGQKENIWCGNCPKCIFVFTALYPFLEGKALIKIFGKNFFENKNLWPTVLALIREKDHKPFECVGTKEETLVALYLSLKKTKKSLPILLTKFKEEIVPKHPNLDQLSNKILNSWNEEHNLPANLEKILKKRLPQN